MAIFTSNTVPQKHLFSSPTLCKYSLALKSSPVSQTNRFSRLLVVRAQAGKIAAKVYISSTGNEPSTNFWDLIAANGSKTGFPSLRSANKRVVNKFVKNLISTVTEDKARRRLVQDKNGRKNLDFRERREASHRNSSISSKDKNIGFKTSKTVVSLVGREKLAGESENAVEIEEGRVEGKVSKKNDEVPLKLKLDRCSKAGDVMGAIQLFDLAQREGTKMGQYHYTVILYLCSSAALGVVQPAKSGTANRQEISVDYPMKSEDFPKDNSWTTELSSVKSEQSKQFDSEMGFEKLESTLMKNKILCSNEALKPSTRFLREVGPGKESGDDDSTSSSKDEEKNQDRKILVSEELKKYALQRGFEIYEKMRLEKVPMNEATLTSVARMAMAMGDGEKAFEMVKQMKPLGINPRLRSYGPALSAFCSSKNIDKAFSLEKHMLDHGVFPEEPELEALLRVSVETDKADKVYYMLHKLRASLRQVSPSTADLISSWFESKAAAMVGKANWDQRKIREAIENGGGGWHGLGWLGKGKWSVLSSNIGGDGVCKSCGEKLATIDLDPIETEAFAESVSSIARKRENNSSFEKFQKWLDYYGPFEAVIDAANVGLFSQRKFMPSKVNLIVNGIRQKFPSKKWPLIVLHNRRITGNKMDKPVNKAFVEKWRNADALYATPTGSNDDWYWLYAAIKFKCLIVTNDEMRDHTFQLLGNDFFPKWKERHQVRFNFSNAGPVFRMPPPCSVVIQESEEGHWHIPIVSEHNDETERKWLCIQRAKPNVKPQRAAARAEEEIENGMVKAAAESKTLENRSQKAAQRNYTNLRKIFSTAVPSDNSALLSEIEAAERVGDCSIDFQI